MRFITSYEVDGLVTGLNRPHEGLRRSIKERGYRAKQALGAFN